MQKKHKPMQKKIKLRKKVCFVVTEKTFKSAITFYIGYTWKEFNAKIEDIKYDTEKSLDPIHENANGLAVGIKNKKNEDCFVLWMSEFAWNVRKIGILSHELIHCTGYILENKQIPIRLENDEVFAYVHEFYLAEALKKL